MKSFGGGIKSFGGRIKDKGGEMKLIKFLAKKWWVFVIVLGFLAIAPISVAAATNPEIIAILKEVLASMRQAGQDAYCASGILALCP